MTVVPIARRAARADLSAAGAEVALVGERVFTVARPPLSPALLFCAIEDNAWRGLRLASNDPLAPVAMWSEVGVGVLRDHHDYPDADMLGHYIAD